jgi:hypothetical protein
VSSAAEIAPSGGVLSFAAESAEADKNTLGDFEIRSLPPGRYLAFGGLEPLQNRAAASPSSVDPGCEALEATLPNPPPRRAGHEPSWERWECTASGVFRDGSDGKVAVFTVQEGEHVSLPTVGEPFYVTLVRLDATPLERPVVVLATSYGVGSGGAAAMSWTRRSSTVSRFHDSRSERRRRVPLAAQPFGVPPVDTVGVTSLSEQSTTSRLLTIAAFCAESNATTFCSSS